MVKLHFFGDKVAFQAAGAEFYRKSSALNLGFYLNQVGFPGPPGAVLGVADLIAGHSMFSAQITSPRHDIFPSLPYIIVPSTLPNFEKNVKWFIKTVARRLKKNSKRVMVFSLLCAIYVV